MVIRQAASNALLWHRETVTLRIVDRIQLPRAYKGVSGSDEFCLLLRARELL